MSVEKIKAKIQTWPQIRETTRKWRAERQKIVFTNGCFDLLHFGHVHYLAGARALGDKLIVGLNSSESVARLKGPGRPLNDDQTRLFVLAAFEFVDAVVLFESDTPLELIELVLPDILVKGGDYRPDEIVGADVVARHGGEVRVLPFQPGYSSTSLLEKMKGA
ncbi:MAG: D-glycero-beta-D-manno-heptose 1-phosphate adenylyltransferase [Bacteroidetes bacterium]|nr:MAG: D-glycero-beta-D-manno-heptose 1-phosphate adenylyltransferase [Bacteroidota bacterium]